MPREDPEGVKDVCEIVGECLDDWAPRGYESEDDYTDDLVEFLRGALDEADEEDEFDGDEDDADDEDGDDDEDEEEDEQPERVLCRPSTPYGTPDILIDDLLVLELKVNPNKAERDRLIGQCCGYSSEWVTWAIVIDMPNDQVEELERLLAAKSLHYIEVIPFN